MSTQGSNLSSKVLVDGLAIVGQLQAVIQAVHVLLDPGTSYDAKVEAATNIVASGLTAYATVRGIEGFDASTVSADLKGLAEDAVKMLNDLDKVTGMKPIA